MKTGIHVYDAPAVFRLDRIKKCRKINKKFRVEYKTRFEEGEFRKRVQFMYPGKLMKIKMKYYGKNPESILDRLPTARIISESDKEILIEAEVYGKGIVMWI